MRWEKQAISTAVALTSGQEAAGAQGLGEKVRVLLTKGDLRAEAEIKGGLFMGEWEGQVELGGLLTSFFFLFIFFSFQFCLNHSTRMSNQPMASPNPGSPQILSSRK